MNEDSGVQAMTAKYLKVNLIWFPFAVKSPVWDVLMWLFPPSGTTRFYQIETHFVNTIKTPSK